MEKIISYYTLSTDVADKLYNDKQIKIYDNTYVNKDNLFDEKNNSYSYTITENGNYSVYIKDIAGNTSNIHEFEIDKIAPTGELHGVENNGITNGNVSFTWTEGGCTCLLNNQTYSKDLGLLIDELYIANITILDKDIIF